jgi:cytochrome subunit of sulfide dehydrogenase
MNAFLRVFLSLPVLLVLSLPARAQPATPPTSPPANAPVSDLQARLWAASCMACHGTDGKAEGTGLSLHGRSADDLYAALLAYRNGSRTGTIMHKHAKGYTEAELQRIAQVFASSR